MWQTIKKRLRVLLPWCMLVVMLSGCGSGIWQMSGRAVENPAQMERLMLAGWSLGQEDGSFAQLLWYLFCGVMPQSLDQQFLGGIPALQNSSGRAVKVITEEEAYYASAFVQDSWKHRFEKVSDVTLSDEVQVILYHTHNAETYLPDAGVSKVTGQNGGVVQAADVFQAALEQKYGVRTIHNTTLHDYPNWNRSYQNSLATVQTLLQTNPQAKAVFDVHRDAGFQSKKPTTTTINGKAAARIMLVIGANHEGWEQNLTFARQLEAKCNELYPGLLRDNIRVKETGRYNQQASPHCVLLEIGSDLNTQAEADYAMECFAQVVHEVLQEQSVPYE